MNFAHTDAQHRPGTGNRNPAGADTARGSQAHGQSGPPGVIVALLASKAGFRLITVWPGDIGSDGAGSCPAAAPGQALSLFTIFRSRSIGILKRKPCASDIGREKFAESEPLLCSVQRRTQTTSVDLYEVFCAVLYRLRTGCQWRHPPAAFPGRQKVSLGRVEALDNKIRVIRRRAYGYRDEAPPRLKIIAGFLPPPAEIARLHPH